MNKNEISRLLQRYKSALDEGKDAYFDADELDELLESFEESDDYTYYDEVLALGLKLHPDNTELQIRQCRSYIYQENYIQALELVDSIAETDNEDLDSLRLECYCMLNKYDKVIGFTEDLIRSECQYLNSIFQTIVPILSDIGMYDEALDYAERGMMLFPDDRYLKDEYCYALEMDGQVEKAIKICNELIDEDPYNSDFWYTLGRLYSMNEEFEKAVDAFDFAITCGSTNDDIKILKAYSLYMNGSYEKAIEVYNEIETTDEEINRSIIPLLAECYIRLNNTEKAYSLLKDYLDKYGKFNDAGVYLHYVRCCMELKLEEEAMAMLIRTGELFPDNIRVLSLLALAYVENKDEDKAKDIIDRLFEVLEDMESKTPEELDYIFQTAHFLHLKGDLDNALEYYKKIYEIQPETPFIHLYMAMAYLEKGDKKNFREHMGKLSLKDVAGFIKDSGYSPEELLSKFNPKHIAPEDLVKEFLKNNDNKN